MPFPFLPLAAAGMGALGGWLFGGKGNQQQQMQPYQPTYMPETVSGVGGDVMTRRLPEGGTLMQTGRFTPEQQSALNQLLSHGLSGMQALPQAEFGPIRQQALSQFQQETVPGIAERFTGPDAQRSSAFAQTLGAAGTGLQERLAAMEQAFNVQRRGQEQAFLLSLLQSGLMPQFETGLMPATPAGPGFTGSLAGGFGQTAGMLAPLMAMKYLL